MPEIRELVDWVGARTSLYISEWLKVQEVRAALHARQVDLAYFKEIGRKDGEPVSTSIKLKTGVSLLFAMLVVVWAPLLIIVSANSLSPPTTARVSSCFVEVSLVVQNGTSGEVSPDYYDLFSVTSRFVDNLTRVSGDTYVFAHGASRLTGQCSMDDVVKEYEAQNPSWTVGLTGPGCSGGSACVQRVQFYGEADQIWLLSPSTRDRLRSQIQEKYFVRSDVRYSCTRSVSATQIADAETELVGEWLDKKASRKLLQMLDLNPAGSLQVSLHRPWALVGSQGGATLSELRAEKDECNQSFDIKLNESNGEFWFNFQEEKATPAMTVIVSPEPSKLLSTVVAQLFTIYTVVVLGMSRMLRTQISGSVQRIQVEELWNCERVVAIIDDMAAAGQCDELMLEKRLYDELMMLFRSPDLLVELCKEKVD